MKLFYKFVSRCPLNEVKHLGPHPTWPEFSYHYKIRTDMYTTLSTYKTLPEEIPIY